MRTRYQGCQKRLSEHSKSLPNLDVGDRVSIQNQHGHRPTKWDRSGIVVEIRDFDKYVVKVDGSGRLTLRNRRYLRKLFDDVGLYGTKPAKKPSCPQQFPGANTQSSTETSNTHNIFNHLTNARTLQEPQPLQPPQRDNNEGHPSNANDEHSTSTAIVQNFPPAVPNRPRRNIPRRLVYDAHRGTYVPCDPGDSIDE